MDELEKVEPVVNTSSDKQDVLNRVIAAGLNSLNPRIPDDAELLNTFVSQSFEKILPCWSYLNDVIQFHVFKLHITEFEEFMRERVED